MVLADVGDGAVAVDEDCVAAAAVLVADFCLSLPTTSPPDDGTEEAAEVAADAVDSCRCAALDLLALGSV